MVGVGTAICLSITTSLRSPCVSNRLPTAHSRAEAPALPAAGGFQTPTAGATRASRPEPLQWPNELDGQRERILVHTRTFTRTHTLNRTCVRSGEPAINQPRSHKHIWTRAQRAPTPPASCTHPHVCPVEERTASDTEDPQLRQKRTRSPQATAASAPHSSSIGAH